MARKPKIETPEDVAKVVAANRPKPKRSMTVRKGYASGGAPGWIYKVLAVVNMIEPNTDDRLEPERVQAFIDDGVTVNFK